MKIVSKIARVIDRIEIILAIVAGGLIVFIGLAICYEVFMRYFLDSPTIWTVEVSRFTLVYITFLGAAWVLKIDGHVRIDIVLNRLNPRINALVNVIHSIISAIVCLVVVWYGVVVTMESFQLGYRLETELRTPQFLILVIVPIGTFFFFTSFVKKIFDYLAVWREPAVMERIRREKAEVLAER